jgi:plasmid maintenance system killer protein
MPRWLQDRAVPPNNQLEALKGDRAGQWRIGFVDNYAIHQRRERCSFSPQMHADARRWT